MSMPAILDRPVGSAAGVLCEEMAVSESGTAAVWVEINGLTVLTVSLETLACRGPLALSATETRTNSQTI